MPTLGQAKSYDLRQVYLDAHIYIRIPGGEANTRGYPCMILWRCCEYWHEYNTEYKQNNYFWKV